ncbi:helix-turn-helix domain-containing protein [Tardiphaga sp. 866_E4_N2_1]|uniref:helix-turn-helix domain-containing protein n=1 Tax=unclassified Tardiphaga TaxID=2631404 RepID=UPI003F2229CF
MLPECAFPELNDRPFVGAIADGTDRPDYTPLHIESRWCQPQDHESPTPHGSVVTRWIGETDELRHVAVTVPSDRHIVSIAIKGARLKLTKNGQKVIDGMMTAGTVLVATPMAELEATFLTPYDFLHVHVPSTHFLTFEGSSTRDDRRASDKPAIFRDSFTQQLCKPLSKRSDGADSEYVRCIGQTLAMHIARIHHHRGRTNALPHWRLRRVVDYIRLNIEETITLSDLAAIAGLSRMHFAAQFRVATGCSPREYLLQQRIDFAKDAIANSGMPLAEVALASGFRSQAHFSTAFKRIVDETPARWRGKQRTNAETRR